MNSKKVVRFAVIGLVLVALMAGNALAQRNVVKQITIKGRIAYLAAEGGYYVQGISPKEIFIITNQNPALLSELVNSRKVVTIRAQLVGGGDIIAITSIDGNAYEGHQEPVFK